MSERPIAAIMYDFDRTLSPKNMQEYAFIPGIGMSVGEFWKKCEKTVKRHNMDPVLAYMYELVQSARGKMLLTRETLRGLGKSVQLFPGVQSWFKRVNDYGKEHNVEVEHYIISSGQKEIIEGTAIAPEFKKIYAAEFCYDADDVPVWPAMAVNYTSKTQFLFRINKGVLDVTEHDDLNEFTPEEVRRVPFRNMVYMGDGLTDVPCLKLTKEYGGHSIAVYSEEEPNEMVSRMLLQGRVNFILKADFSRGKGLEKTVFAIIDQIAATHKTVSIHTEHLKLAEETVNGCALPPTHKTEGGK